MTQGTPQGRIYAVATYDNEAARKSKLRKLLSAGTAITGSVAGAATSLLLGGSEGAIVGAMTGSALTNTIDDIVDRVLSQREKIRVGALCQYAAEAINDRMDSEGIRDDGFFFALPGKRSSGEEVFEAVLIAAQREPEERKVEYMGHLFANLCFEKAVDRNLANWTVKTAQDLTWTQLILLSIVGRKDDFDVPDLDMDARGTETEWRTWGLRDQLADLGLSRRAMIAAPFVPEEGKKLPRLNTHLRDQRLQGNGHLLFALMDLDRIPSEDVEDILDNLID